MSRFFWSHVDKSADCWLWTGYVDKDGYGRVKAKNRMMTAHRRSYELANGIEPSGLVIDHLCRNRRCVNPAHLRAITSQENTRVGKGLRTHCVHGHAFTPENTYMRKGTVADRRCRACGRRAMQEYKRRQRRTA